MKNDNALMALSGKIKEGRPVGYSDLTDDQRREYQAKKNRESRARQRVAVEKGEPLPTKTNVRTVLADAALMLLATDGPGAEQIRTVLAAAFPSKPGLLLRVEQQAKFGTLRPKFVDAGRMADHNATLPKTTAPEPVVRKSAVAALAAAVSSSGTMTPEEVEAIVPAFLRRT